MPDAPLIIPAVGKSGPGKTSKSSSTEISGLSIIRRQASVTSVKLCGGMFVAIPTAIPEDPLTSRLGTRVGNTEGSLSEPS